jgi:hypothetical protein
LDVKSQDAERLPLRFGFIMVNHVLLSKNTF